MVAGLTLLSALAAGLAAGLLTGPGPARRRLALLVAARSERTGGAGPEGSPGDPPRRRPGQGWAGPQARVLAAGVAGLGVSLLLGGPVGWVAGVVAAVVLIRRLGGLESARSVREARRMEEALPLVADLLSAAVTAGAPPVVAARVVGEATGGPLGHRLVDAARVAELGGDATDSWVGLAQHPPLARLARTLSAAGERGIAPAEALARLAADARDAARWSAEARARALGARAAAPLGLCFLPAFVLVGVVPAVAAAGSLLP